jgi:hypothetical protein
MTEDCKERLKTVLMMLRIFAAFFFAETGWASDGTVYTSALGSSQISVTTNTTDNSQTITITVTNAPTSASPTPTASPSPRATCPPGQVLCAGGCSDPMTDRNNCGGCGQVCGPLQTCINGHCIGGVIRTLPSPTSTGASLAALSDVSCAVVGTITGYTIQLTFALTAAAPADTPVSLTVAPTNPGGFPASVTIPAGNANYSLAFQRTGKLPGPGTFTLTASVGGVSRTTTVYFP